MNTTVKVLLGLIAGATLMCLLVAAGGFMFLRATGGAVVEELNTDAATVGEVSKAIADYTLPAGFGHAFATEVADVCFVSYTGADDSSHIFLFQLPAYLHVDQAEIERQMRDSAGSKQVSVDRMQEVGRESVTIAGQDSEMIISEGTNGNGEAYRSVTIPFQGHGGQAMVMVSGPIATWDQEMVDSFIASIQ